MILKTLFLWRNLNVIKFLRLDFDWIFKVIIPMVGFQMQPVLLLGVLQQEQGIHLSLLGMLLYFRLKIFQVIGLDASHVDHRVGVLVPL